MQDVPNDTAAVIAGLQAQIDELRCELARVMPPPTTDDPATAAEPVANRRSLLKLAGATAVGTVASLTVANRAAAEIGYDGTQNVADAVNQRQTASRPGKTAFVFETVGGSGVNDSTFPGALGGWAWDADAPTGVYGYSGVDAGVGVVGFAAATAGIGVFGVTTDIDGAGVVATGPRRGLIARSSAAESAAIEGQGPDGDGIGVYGTGHWGVLGQASNIGVQGTGQGRGVVARCESATGQALETQGGLIGVAVQTAVANAKGVDVSATSRGVDARASAANGKGVIGTCFGATGTGVSGIGGNHGVEGYSESDNGIGGWFGGLAGAIQLSGWQDTAPTARTRAHERGVIENLTNGDVWYCYEAGTPGKWRKLSGGSTAGAFHPLAPGRVYDSREALPSPGALSGGQSRTISVADRRATSGGAVTLADFVPAGATAVAANVTVVSVAGGGFLACNPGGITEVTASTINWSAPDQAIANGVILALNANRELTIVAGGGTTHLLVDITGYWL